MSANTPNTPEEDAVEAALAAWFAAENDGAILTGYFVTMKGKTMSDFDREVTRYNTLSPDHMEYDQVLGLARWGELQVESSFEEDDE